MSYKLKGQALAFVASHMTLCRAHRNAASRAYVTVDEEDNVSRVMAFLQNTYPVKKFDDTSITDLDFVMVFKDSETRYNVVNDINAAVAEYLEAHPEVINPDYEPPVDNAPPASDGEESDEDEEKTKTDWTTYIIIGAAVAIIIALLVWKRK